MFEELDDIIHKGERQPFDELLEKGMAALGGLNGPAPKKPVKKTQIAGSAVPGSGATGAQAGIKTQTTMNANLVPQKVMTPTGMQEQQMNPENVIKTPDVKPVIPASKLQNKPAPPQKTPPPATDAKPAPNTPAPTTSAPESTVNEQNAAAKAPRREERRPKPQPTQTADGEPLAQLDPNNPEKTAPVQFIHTPKTKWFEQKIQHGDDVTFNVAHPTAGTMHQITGTVVEKNPETNMMMVKKQNGDVIPVTYHDVLHFERPDGEGKVHKYKFNENVHTPSVGAPTEEPVKVLPIEHQQELKAAHAQHRANKLQLLAQHLKPADWISYYAPDPETGEYKMQYGHVVDVAQQPAATDPKTGAKKAKGPNPNQKILIFDGEKTIPVPLAMVETFAREHDIHGELEHFGYDAKKGGMKKLDYAMGAEQPSKPSEWKKFETEEAPAQEKQLKEGQIHPDIEPIQPFEGEQEQKQAHEEVDPYADLTPQHFEQAKMAIDKLNNHRMTNPEMPFAVLKARHDLNAGKNIAEATQVINNFVSNSGKVDNVKPPVTMMDYQKELGMSLTDPNILNVAQKHFASDKPANHFLEAKQHDLVSKLHALASEKGFKVLADKIASIPLNNDNRKLIDFYKGMLKSYLDTSAKANGKDAHPPIDIHVPSDEHVDMADHLHDLTEHLKQQNLFSPSYQTKSEILAQMMQENPDDPWVHKTFNELHKLGHDSGTSDPLFQFDTIVDQYEKAGGLEDPELKFKAEQIIEGVKHKTIDPGMGLKKLAQLMGQGGIKFQLPEQSEITHAQAGYKKLNDLHQQKIISHKNQQLQNDLQQLDKEIKAHEGEVNNQPSANAKGLQTPEPQDETPEVKVKAFQHKMDALYHKIQNAEQTLQLIYDKGLYGENGGGAQQSAITQGILNSLQGSIDEYNKYGMQLQQHGVDFQPYVMQAKPKVAPEENKYDPEQAAAQTNNVIHSAYDSLANMATKRFQQTRQNIMDNAKFYSPDVQHDLAEIDNTIKQAGQDGKPLPLDIAKTPFGMKLIMAYNDWYVQQYDSDYKKTKHTIKSLAEVVEAEKVLARRDISLALRKSFYNDVNSPELRHATELLGSYFDEFIDVVMNTYKAIPVEVRKSANRSLLKGLIKDVIKNNEFSAATMNEDFTAPLTDGVIKSMGQQIAAIATDFRMDAPSDKPMFVFDLSKSATKATKIPTARGKVTHNFKLVKSEKYTSEQWLDKLVALETVMHKAGMFPNRTNENRFRKFIKDNDQNALKSFYNENLQQLNDRISGEEQ